MLDAIVSIRVRRCSSLVWVPAWKPGREKPVKRTLCGDVERSAPGQHRLFHPGGALVHQTSVSSNRNALGSTRRRDVALAYEETHPFIHPFVDNSGWTEVRRILIRGDRV